MLLLCKKVFNLRALTLIVLVPKTPIMIKLYSKTKVVIQMNIMVQNSQQYVLLIEEKSINFQINYKTIRVLYNLHLADLTFNN